MSNTATSATRSRTARLAADCWSTRGTGSFREATSGPAIEPRSLDDSVLWGAITYDTFQMPPEKKMPADVIADFKKWIEMGAPDPRLREKLSVTSTIDIEAGRKHWAFQKPVRPSRAGIDLFVDGKLLEAKLTPTEAADPATLLRRLSFDLVGLPPSPEEVKAFLAASRKSSLAFGRPASNSGEAERGWSSDRFFKCEIRSTRSRAGSTTSTKMVDLERLRWEFRIRTSSKPACSFEVTSRSPRRKSTADSSRSSTLTARLRTTPSIRTTSCCGEPTRGNWTPSPCGIPFWLLEEI